ncbi:MAG: hypothetical protein AMXMBFR33_21510 [Candidatus Xenobia bacterium]
MRVRLTYGLLAALILGGAHWSWAWQTRAGELERQRDQQRMRLLAFQLEDEYTALILESGGDRSRIRTLQAELTRLAPLAPSGREALSRLVQYGAEALALVQSGQQQRSEMLLLSKIQPAARELAGSLPPDPPVYASRQALDWEGALLAAGALVLMALLSWPGRRLTPEPLPLSTHPYADRVLRSLSNLLVVVGADGIVRAVNGVACNVLGYSEEELVGQPFKSILQSSSSPVTMASCRNLEAVYRARDGSPIPVLMSCSLVSGESGELKALVTVAQDISDRKQAESRLAVKEARLRELLDRLITAQEEERRSVARDLHDGMLQYVIAADLQLQMFKKRRGEESLARAVEFLKGSVEEGRRLIYDLRPSALEQLGLVETLRRQLEDARQELGWEVTFRNELGGTNIPGALETGLYRIAGECLSNARRHSRAERVALRLSLEEGEIRLEFQDWGVGFDTEQSPEGVGLQSMRERVELLGGWLQIESRPGEGTLVRAGFPLS